MENLFVKVMMKFVTSLLLVLYVSAANYILTPKNYLSFASIGNLADELELDFLAIFDSLPIYIAPDHVVERFKTTLGAFFDVEEDVQIHLNERDTKQFVLMDDATIFDQKDWHLRRVTQRENHPQSHSFNYTEKGSCHRNNDTIINAYVIDTGIDIHHEQFEGRAHWLANFADEEDTDCNSHGTHVAGIIGSKNFGVCVDANLYAIKVLNCRGSGTLSSVIKGIAFAYESHLNVSESHASSNKTIKSVVNMSLGGGKSRAIDRAVKEVMSQSSDFYMVVAAGNENSDACDGSPSGSPYVLTVMASDKADGRAYFSNWGECADIYAPGVDIWSTVPDGKVAKYSGTSMASPLTAGVLIHYIDQFPEKNMTGIMEKMAEMATKNIIQGEIKDTTNDLLFLTRN